MPFQTACASMIGKTHRQLLYNNQDAYFLFQNEEILVAVVCDGCGSAHHSEVGAQLSAQFVGNYCKKHFSQQPFHLEQLQTALEKYWLQLLNNQEEKEEFVHSYLLTTIIGIVIQEENTYVFTAGDGIFAINENWWVLNQQNRPEYLAMNLIDDAKRAFSSYQYRTETIEQFLIATDGLNYLQDEHRELLLENGTVAKVKNILEEDRLFRHPVELPKYFALLNDTILYDDTTVVMGKR
ncbi:MAG: protein phosphatase 2C domain-containing protein [Bacteroidia bacterium]